MPSNQEMWRYVPWLLILLFALWLLSTGAQGVFHSQSLIGILFGLVIFLVGFQLLTKNSLRPKRDDWDENNDNH